MNTDIYNDSDLWSSTITEQLLDRLVVEGNSSFCLFFLLSLLKSKSAELLSVTEPLVLADRLLSCPWSVLEKDMPALLRDAVTLMNETPTSTLYALYGLLSQCSSGLLPVAVQGSPELWTIRMTEFYSFFYPFSSYPLVVSTPRNWAEFRHCWSNGREKKTCSRRRV